jgi:general secretion pathway protein G
VLYNKGQVYYTTGGTYTGTNAPESTAAFPTDAEDPHNLISDSIGGNPAYDDQVWLKLGTPFRRPLPRGIHLIDRLLLSHNIFPDGPLETATHDSAASAKPSKLSSRDKDRVEQAQREVQDLYIALRTYWRNNGRYPPSGKRNLLIYLDGDPKNGGSSEVYYLFKPDSRVQSNSFLDPWGRPYLYRAPAQKVGEPMVWSAGPDGKNQRGKGDDVEIGAPR